MKKIIVCLDQLYENYFLELSYLNFLAGILLLVITFNNFWFTVAYLSCIGFLFLFLIVFGIRYTIKLNKLSNKM